MLAIKLVIYREHVEDLGSSITVHVQRNLSVVIIKLIGKDFMLIWSENSLGVK